MEREESYYKIESRTRGIPIQYGLKKLTEEELNNVELLSKLEIFKEITPNHFFRQSFENGVFVDAKEVKNNDVLEIVGNLDAREVAKQFNKKFGVR